MAKKKQENDIAKKAAMTAKEQPPKERFSGYIIHEEKKEPEEPQGPDTFFGVLSKKNIWELVIFTGVSTLLFFILPFLYGVFLPEELAVNIFALQVLLINTIFMGFVGWFANDFRRNQAYVPAIYLALYALSRYMFDHVFDSFNIFNYLETTYILFFLNLMIRRRKRLEEKRRNKPFPKGINNRRN